MLNQEDDRYTLKTLNLGRHEYIGCSIAGEYTFHAFPNLKICLDLGLAPLSVTNINNIFFTHCHTDHCNDLVRHCWRRHMRRLSLANYYASEEDAALLNDMVSSAARASRGQPVLPVQAITKPILIKDYAVAPFVSHHRIPCQGYEISFKRDKLLPKYKGIAYEDLKALRASGVETNAISYHAEIAFCGDTNIDVLSTQPQLLNTDTLILECTGIDNKMDADKCYANGHIHLAHLEEFFKEHEFCGKYLALTHFSARYSQKQILETINSSSLPKELLARIVLL